MFNLVVEFFLLGFAIFSQNAVASKVVHWSSDNTKVIRQTHMVELRGSAHFSRNDEDLHADEIDYNQETQFIKARGRVQYQYGSFFVKADSIDLDLEKKTGVIYNGNLTNGTFALRGSKMEQLAKDRFLVTDYDYTTCKDCPNAWSMTGKEADLTIDGYAYIKDFVFKLKEAPMIWAPWMVIPIKTRRQTGLLFPRFGVNEVHGVYIVAPAYWAINEWSDTTLGLGYYSTRGGRLEWEGRYALTNRSRGTANVYLTHDTEIPTLSNRYAMKVALTQELPWNFEAKLKVNEVSDSGYPIIYSEDISGRLEPVLTSDLFISRNDPNVSTVFSLRRFRNLLFLDNNATPNPIAGFDPRTVQEFPRIVINTNDQFLFGSKIAAGLETRLNRFSRSSAVSPFDFFKDPNPTNPDNPVIREANRFTVIPNLYTTLNPWPWLSLVPSVQYRGFVYNFDNAPNYPTLARGYLLAQAEMSLQLEKVVQTENPAVSFKHTIRPQLTYSAIPMIQESRDHPFISQIQQKARPGQYFDYWDIVPLETSQDLDTYFTPLGHSLTYGVTTQIFKREMQKNGEMKVSRRFEAKALQTWDILATGQTPLAGQPDNRIILSPLFAQLTYSDSKLSAGIEYTYYSYLDRYVPNNAQILTYHSPHRFSTSVGWNIERALRDGVMKFDRSVALTYSFAKLISSYSSMTADFHYSINDYIMPEVRYVFDLMTNPNQILEYRYGLLFQSPARCWSLDTAITRSIDRGFGFIFSFALNLTGGTVAAVPK